MAGINNCDVKILACSSSTAWMLVKVASAISAAIIAIHIRVITIVVIGRHVVERTIVIIAVIYMTTI